jgi:hypothetical protein
LFSDFPKFTHQTVSQLIIQTKLNTTRDCLILTADNRLETVAILHPVGWIEATNITINYVLWRRQQTRTRNQGAVFKPCIALPQNKSIPVVIYIRAGKVTCAAKPPRRTRTVNKIILCSPYCRCTYSNRYPKWTICGGRDSEDFTSIISDLPVATIVSLTQGCGEIHRQINRLAGRNLPGKRHKMIPTHCVAANEQNPIRFFPWACASVSQSPDLCEGTAWHKNRVVWYRQTLNKFNSVATFIRCRAWAECLFWMWS